MPRVKRPKPKGEEQPEKKSAAPVPRVSYRVSEAAEATGLGVRTIWRLIASGDIKTRRLGSVTVIRAEDLKAYVDAAPVTNAAQS